MEAVFSKWSPQALRSVFSRVFLEGLTITWKGVLQLIRSLDSEKAHGCDEISVAMIEICDTSIVEPLCLIFEEFFKWAHTHLCGKKQL